MDRGRADPARQVRGRAEFKKGGEDARQPQERCHAYPRQALPRHAIDVGARCRYGPDHLDQRVGASKGWVKGSGTQHSREQLLGNRMCRQEAKKSVTRISGICTMTTGTDAAVSRRFHHDYNPENGGNIPGLGRVWTRPTPRPPSSRNASNFVAGGHSRQSSHEPRRASGHFPRLDCVVALFHC